MKLNINSLIIFFVIIITISLVYFFSVNSTKPASSDVSPQEVKSAIDSGKNISILDVRTIEEYKANHLKNSILLTLDTIPDKASKIIPDKNKEYFLYCRTGIRSAMAVAKLKELGYANIHSMSGGINAWINAGFPVVK